MYGIWILLIFLIIYIGQTKCNKLRSSEDLWIEHALATGQTISCVGKKIEQWYERYYRLPKQNGYIADLVIRMAYDKKNAIIAGKELSDFTYKNSSLHGLTIMVNPHNEIMNYINARWEDYQSKIDASVILSQKIAQVNWTIVSHTINTLFKIKDFVVF
jgi:hypothetical protein